MPNTHSNQKSNELADEESNQRANTSAHHRTADASAYDCTTKLLLFSILC